MDLKIKIKKELGGKMLGFKYLIIYSKKDIIVQRSIQLDIYPFKLEIDIPPHGYISTGFKLLDMIEFRIGLGIYL